LRSHNPYIPQVRVVMIGIQTSSEVNAMRVLWAISSPEAKLLLETIENAAFTHMIHGF
jgi:hypothetical protein